MREHLEPIITEAGIRDLAEKLSRKNRIAFDTEFIRETTFFPQLELIQVASDEDAWVIDFQAFAKGKCTEALQPLLRLFEDPGILKIVHAAQADQECLFTALGIVASPILDTAVAASLLGHGDSPGLGSILQDFLQVSLEKGHARTHWSARPLPEKLLHYALADVSHLVRLADVLLDRLDRKKRREWALHLSAEWADPKAYDTGPDDFFMNLAQGGRVDGQGLNVLRRLVRWREENVRHDDIPRKWLADDGVLLDLARVRPQTLHHLSHFRGLNKGILKKHGDTIVRLVQEGMSEPPLEISLRRKPKPPTRDEQELMEMLKSFLSILASQHQVSQKVLATSAQVLLLLRAHAKTSEDFVNQNLLTPEASALIGDEIIAFLQGRRALTVRDFKVHIVETR